MSPDYRSERMESQEGRGIARRAWERYAAAVNRSPINDLLTKALTPWAATTVSDLTGFWLLWHLEGGFEGLERMGMNRSTIYRRIAKFRDLYGQHPDEFELPGVSIDLKAYVEGKTP